MEKIATLSQLRAYLEKGMSLENVIKEVEEKHGIVKIFEHSPELMKGMKFRYHVMPLDKNNKPITKLAKGAQLQ